MTLSLAKFEAHPPFSLSLYIDPFISAFQISRPNLFAFDYSTRATSTRTAIMNSKDNDKALPGFTAAETVILAAAYLHGHTTDISFDKLCAHVGSKSVKSVRERLRLARKKEVEVDGTTLKWKANGDSKSDKLDNVEAIDSFEPEAIAKVNASEQEDLTHTIAEKLALSSVGRAFKLLNDKIEKLSTENATMVTDKINLKSEHDKLKSDYNTLKTEHSGLNSANTAYKKENHDLKRLSIKLKTEIDGLKAEIITLKTGKDNLNIENNELKSGNEKLKADNAKLKAEKQKFESDYRQLKRKLAKHEEKRALKKKLRELESSDDSDLESRPSKREKLE